MPDNGKISSTDSTTQEYVLEQQIGFLLRRIHQQASRIFQEHMAPLALTPPQFSALVKLYESGPVTQNRLGRMIDTDPATIQGITHRLSERGHMIRTQDPEHRRRILVELTDQGRAAVEQALPLAARVTSETLSPLSQSEQAQLTTLLRKLAPDPDPA